MKRPRALGFLLLAFTLAACGSGGHPSKWQTVHENLPSALLSVWGTSTSDVWAVGADAGDGLGPVVLHFDGVGWTRYETGEVGDLWWVFGFANGPTYLGGVGGTILRYQDGAFTRMTTPGNGTVFGIWGTSTTNVWAVGGAAGGAQGAFAWRLEGDAWVAASGFPPGLAVTDSIWKMFGRQADDAWLVGTSGKVVHWDGSTLSEASTGIGESLFTVHASAERFVAVGGFGTGVILENNGSGWVDVSPSGAPQMTGVCLAGNRGYAVGPFGVVYGRGSAGWAMEDTGLSIDESLHSVWIDPEGGVWAVGGQVASFPLINGVMLHKGEPVPAGID